MDIRNNWIKKPLIAAAFGASMALAPAAQADSGVGRVIAAQGNLALKLIKAEIKDSIEAWKPSLSDVAQPQPKAIKTRAPAPKANVADGMAASATSRCAP